MPQPGPQAWYPGVPPVGPRRDPLLVVAGVVCLFAPISFGAMLLFFSGFSFSGIFASSSITRVGSGPLTRGEGLFLSRVDSAEGYFGQYDGSLGLTGVLVHLLFVALAVGLVVIGVGLIAGRDQQRWAAVLAGTSTLSLSAAFGWLNVLLYFEQSLLGTLILVAWSPAIIATVLVLFRLPWRRQPARPVLLGLAAAAGATWLVLDAVSGTWHFPLMLGVLLLTTVAVAVAAVWLVPPRIGAGLLLGWVLALAARLVIDASALVTFGSYRFTGDYGRVLTVGPVWLVVSVVVGLAVVAAAVVLRALLTRSARDAPRLSDSGGS
jgi:hypothetical protein